MYKNIIDTHAHVLNESYKGRRQEIIDLVISQNINIINIGVDWDSSIECIEIAKIHKNFKAVIGIHPTDSEKYDNTIFPKLEKLYLDNKDLVVAIGETGIDNKYQISKEKQIHMFKKHIELAKKLNLPIVIHNREAFDEVKPIINEYKDVNFLMHSWTGNINQMKKYIAPNMWFAFGGIVTFNNAKDIAECLDIVPRDKIFIETDCPWLAPTPFRGKENDPTKVVYVAEFIAKRWKIKTQDVLDLTYNNAIKFF